MSQIKVGVKTDLAGAAPFIAPLADPNVFSYKTVCQFDFLDDSRFYPTTAQYEWGQYEPVFNQWGGYVGDEADDDTRYRAWRDGYQKAMNGENIARAERNPIKPNRVTFYPTPESDPSRDGYWNGVQFPFHKWEQVNFTLTSFEGGEHPFMYGFNTIFNDTSKPIVMCNTKVMIPIRDAARRMGMNEMGVFWVTGDTYSSTGSTTNEFWNSAGPISSDYDALLLKLRNGVITEAERITLENIESIAIDFWSKEEYYPSVWSNSDYVAMFNNPNPNHPINAIQLYDPTYNTFMAKYGTNHPDGTTPFDVLGDITDITFLSYVKHIKELPETGNAGECIKLVDYDYSGNNNHVFKYFAWDPQNQKWSEGFFNRFIEPIRTMQRALRDAKAKAKNEVLLSIRPFTFAALHCIDYRITKNLINGEV